MSMNNKIKIGDTVRLKGQPDSPVMTVTGYGPTSNGNEGTRYPLCAWFDKHQVCREKFIAPDALELVDTNAPMVIDPLPASDIMYIANGGTLRFAEPGKWVREVKEAEKPAITDFPDLGDKYGRYHWYTNEEGGTLIPMWRTAFTKEHLLEGVFESNVHSIFLASHPSLPPKTWPEVWALIGDNIYDIVDGRPVKRGIVREEPKPEQPAQDEWHYITGEDEWRKYKESGTPFQGIRLMPKPDLTEVAVWKDGVEPIEVLVGYFGHPSNIRIRKSDMIG